MKKSNKKTNYPQKTNEPAGKKHFNKSLALSLLVNTVILTIIYFAALSLEHPIISFAVMGVYLLVFGGFLVAYIIYNRAFTRKGITEDMLPDSWSAEKKKEYIEDGIRRQEKSKWMLTVMIPFMIPIAADAMYMFLWQGILEPIFANTFLALTLSFLV